MGFDPFSKHVPASILSKAGSHSKRILEQGAIDAKILKINNMSSEFQQYITDTTVILNDIDALATRNNITNKLVGETSTAFVVALTPHAGPSLSVRLTGFTNACNSVINELKHGRENYFAIEGTSKLIISRTEELLGMQQLVENYYELLRTDSPSSSSFWDTCSDVRKKYTSGLQEIGKKRLERITDELNQAMAQKLPETLSESEIEKIIRKMYGNAITEDQIKSLSKNYAMLLNNYEITDVNGDKYVVTMDEFGNYTLNGEKKEKVEIDVLIGKLNYNSTVNVGVTPNAKFDMFKGGSASSGFKLGVSSSIEIFAAKLIQNGVPLISLNNGEIELFKNTRLTILSIYAGAVAKKDSSIPYYIEVGADLVKLDTEIISIPIGGNKVITVEGEASVGLSSKLGIINKGKGASGFEFKFTPGVGGGGKIKIEEKGYEENSLKDFEF